MLIRDFSSQQPVTLRICTTHKTDQKQLPFRGISRSEPHHSIGSFIPSPVYPNVPKANVLNDTSVQSLLKEGSIPFSIVKHKTKWWTNPDSNGDSWFFRPVHRPTLLFVHKKCTQRRFPLKKLTTFGANTYYTVFLANSM